MTSALDLVSRSTGISWTSNLPHDNRRVVRVCEHGDGASIWNGVDATQLHVDLQANIRKVLQLGARALGALKALCRDTLRNVTEAMDRDQREYTVRFSISHTA